MNYKEKLEIFKSSCSVYPREKAELEKQKMSISKPDPVQEQLYDYMQKDVDYVESSFQVIYEKCGTNARLLTWILFVYRQTQTAVAEECHISRRQLQYSMDRCMHILLDENTQPITYKDRLHAVKSSCRMYLQEKKKVEESRSNPKSDFIHVKLIQYVEDDIAFTESVFSRINQKYGDEATELTEKVLIKGHTQEEVSREYGITKRKLEYSMGKWIKDALEDIK